MKAPRTKELSSKILACVGCRNSKVKCHTDGTGSCKRCLEHRLTCIRPEYQRLKKVKASLARFQEAEAVKQEVSHYISTPPLSLQQTSTPLESPTVLFSSNPLYGKSAQLMSNLHIVRPDVRLDWDPVSAGIIDERTSRELFTTFMVKLEPLLSFFDPRIHSFDYIKGRSCFLFTTICWLAAAVTPYTETAMHQLKAHIDNVLLPAIYYQNLRSVELAQAFLMLAAYSRPAENPSEDRSWTLLGHAIRIATDLDMHSRVVSLDPSASPSDIWQQRNKERAWMHIWLHEASASNYTGRVSLLAKDPIIEASRGWHLHPEALHTDVVFVALIQLRTLLAQNKELFRLLSTANTKQHTSAKELIDRDSSWIQHYLDRCHRDLSAWEERWVGGAAQAKPQPRPLRLELGSLYICYARMQLLSVALQSSLLQPDLTTRVVSDLHTVSIRYLEDFLARTSPQRLAYSYNSICVTATYAVIIALKLTRLGPSYSFIESQRIVRLVTKVSQYLREGGHMTPHQNGSSLSYASYIDQLLDKEHDTNTKNQRDAVSVLDDHLGPNDSVPEPVSYGVLQAAGTPALLEQTPSDGTQWSFLANDPELFAWARSFLDDVPVSLY